MSKLARRSTSDADRPAAPCSHANAAAAFAVGALSGDELHAISLHLAFCDHCAHDVEVLRQVADSLVAWPTDLLRPPDALRARLLSSVGAVMPVGFAYPPDRWRTVAPNISVCLLSTDEETNQVGMFVRLAKGGVYPAHTHASVEDLF